MTSTHTATGQKDTFDKGSVVSLRVAAGAAPYSFEGLHRAKCQDHPKPGPLARQSYWLSTRHLQRNRQESRERSKTRSTLVPIVLTDDSMPHVATDYATTSSSLKRNMQRMKSPHAAAPVCCKCSCLCPPLSSDNKFAHGGFWSYQCSRRT